MKITYEEAKAAVARGEKVEVKCNCPDATWREFRGENATYWHHQFRLADPYAELKAAKAAGKVIQEHLHGEWHNLDKHAEPWSLPFDRYRIKPDELKIEAGKIYRTRDGRMAQVYSTEGVAAQEVHGAVFVNGWYMHTWHPDGVLFSGHKNNLDLIDPWTDEPIPYDNFAHAGTCCQVPIKFVGLCDLGWEQSLQERPR